MPSAVPAPRSPAPECDWIHARSRIERRVRRHSRDCLVIAARLRRGSGVSFAHGEGCRCCTSDFAPDSSAFQITKDLTMKDVTGENCKKRSHCRELMMASIATRPGCPAVALCCAMPLCEGPRRVNPSAGVRRDRGTG